MLISGAGDLASFTTIRLPLPDARMSATDCSRTRATSALATGLPRSGQSVSASRFRTKANRKESRPEAGLTRFERFVGYPSLILFFASSSGCAEKRIIGKSRLLPPSLAVAGSSPTRAGL
jgi:hypothetical protein